MNQSPKIIIIIGSVRTRRIGPQVARWVREVASGVISLPIEIIDLKDWPLPMDEELGIPAAGHYEFEHTRAWSRKILEGAAIVFVTPQYNWGYPASLKNAIDHLYKEWVGKPAMIVTYGGHSGDKCAAQLRQILEAVHMKTISTMPGFKIPRSTIEANTGEIDPEAVFAESAESKDELRKGFEELAAALSVLDQPA
jgi:NAD(P)H-dependent FMN reductase